MSSAAGTSVSLPQISADRTLPSNLEGTETSALQAGAVSGGERPQMIKAGGKKGPKHIGTAPKENCFLR